MVIIPLIAEAIAISREIKLFLRLAGSPVSTGSSTYHNINNMTGM
jgi:hypothetical protein